MPCDKAGLPEALRSPEAWPHDIDAIRIVETHISWVLLTGEYAYKIKKPVRLPFVDFSTLDRREHFCHEELRLNARLAPEIYLDVVSIGGTAAKPRIGATPAIEYAVKMRQFDIDATADRLIENGSLAADELAELAGRIAGFHQSLAPADAAPPERAVLKNLDELIAMLAGTDSPGFNAVIESVRQETRRLAAALAARGAGALRECHGDLHLGNIARIGRRLVPFDCLEFDLSFRTIDVIDEIAFLFMDLACHERRDLAFVFLNRWLEITGDYDGLRLLRLYAAHRALVRAKVAWIGAAHSAAGPASAVAGRYMKWAKRDIAASPGPVLICSGLSGSGKTTIARELAPMIGAVHVRSDVERKRLSRLGSLTRTGAGLNQGIYRQEVSDATYAALRNTAEAALAGRMTVIVDATFLAPERRETFRALAEEYAAPFRILHCVASANTLRARIRRRAGERSDPSDADESILEHQLATAEPPGDEEKAVVLTIDTERAPDIQRIAASIDAIDRR